MELLVQRGTHYEPKKVTSYGSTIWKTCPLRIYYDITLYPSCCGLMILSEVLGDDKATSTRQLYRWIDRVWESVREEVRGEGINAISCVIPINITNSGDAYDDGESTTAFCMRTVIKRWVQKGYIVIEGEEEFPNKNSGNDLKHVLFTIA